MDRFTQELPSNLACMAQIWGDNDVPAEPETKCFYCDRVGGTPAVVIGGEEHCTRCFEDFTEAEFAQYLVDAGCVPDEVAWGPGHPLYTLAVAVCSNCTQSAERLTPSPADEKFLMCDECMESAEASRAAEAKAEADQTLDLLVRAGCTSAETSAYIREFEGVA